MSVDQASLGLTGDPSSLRLRELNGFDEQSIFGLDTTTAIGLLDRLLVNAPGSSAEDLKAARLTASQRDRLLAAVYERTFGPRIDNTIRCTLCGELFDLSFTIDNLLAVVSASASSSSADLQPDGTFRLPNGVVFRLPTGQDEMAIAGLSPIDAESALLERCLIEPDGSIDLEAVQKAMEEVAPILDLDLDAQCPECGGKQSVRFDVQYFLLRALELERKQMAREVHRLAIAYGWSLNEILGLFRSQRRAFVELIEADLSLQRRQLS
jgi:hypothetical protein